MIPALNIIAWSKTTPWAEPRQVEQDLIIARALVLKGFEHVEQDFDVMPDSDLTKRMRIWVTGCISPVETVPKFFSLGLGDHVYRFGNSEKIRLTESTKII